jgi:hypothetical protein
MRTIHPTERLVALALLCGLAAPACRKQGAVAAAGAAAMTAVTITQCPSDLESLGKLNFELGLGVDARTGQDLRDAIAGLADIKRQLGTLDQRLATVCSQLALDLGAPGPSSADPSTACGGMLSALPNLGDRAQELVKVVDPRLVLSCGYPVQAMSACVGRCMTGETDVSARVTCYSKRSMGSCGGVCTGSCKLATPGACNGDCSGVCSGEFMGHCGGVCRGTCDGKPSSAASCAGVCNGKCEGSAAGACMGTCAGVCALREPTACAGTCIGTCASSFESESCVGWASANYGSPACNGRCAAALFGQMKCEGSFDAGAGHALSSLQVHARAAVELAGFAPLTLTAARTTLHALDSVAASARGVATSSSAPTELALRVAALAKCLAPVLREVDDVRAKLEADVRVAKDVRDTFARQAALPGPR